jgi:hypothetical protein
MAHWWGVSQSIIMFDNAAVGLIRVTGKGGE